PSGSSNLLGTILLDELHAARSSKICSILLPALILQFSQDPGSSPKCPDPVSLSVGSTAAKLVASFIAFVSRQEASHASIAKLLL
ncbi:hypothetical protein GOP47_0018073, partial [Adiantum capillus-veneris]